MKQYFLFIACLWYSGAFAQNPKFENYFSSLGDQLNGNILLAQNGRVVLSHAAGYADFVNHTPNTPDARFNMASVSKLFTSTAILQLKEKEKLSLDDPLTKFIPDFPFADVTIRHLLTHTSGVPDLELFENLVNRYPDTVITNSNILPELKKWKQGLAFKPGSQFRYCNIGYCLLAMVVEKVSKQSFGSYLDREIFKPSGMNHTYLSVYPGHYYKRDKSVVKMHAKAHPYYDSTFTYVDSLAQFNYTNKNYSGTVGDGAIISTTGDMLQFDRAFFDGRLLKSSTIEEALTPIKLNGVVFYNERMDTMEGEGKMAVGLGWDIFEMPGYGKSVGHGGFMFGNSVFYFHNIGKKQTIIAFDNTAGSEFGRIVTSALYLLNGKEPMEIRNHHSMAFVYGSTLVKNGPDAAAAAFNMIRSDTAHYYLSEWEFNQLGGNLLNAAKFNGHDTSALEVFKLNTILFPNSANTYDSYAFALRAVGKKKEAIQMYQKSLAMDPNNDDGKQALKELMQGK